eukprot:1162075-Pelagomonas_calceolata.AAC.17
MCSQHSYGQNLGEVQEKGTFRDGVQLSISVSDQTPNSPKGVWGQEEQPSLNHTGSCFPLE